MNNKLYVPTSKNSTVKYNKDKFVQIIKTVVGKKNKIYSTVLFKNVFNIDKDKLIKKDFKQFIYYCHILTSWIKQIETKLSCAVMAESDKFGNYIYIVSNKTELKEYTAKQNKIKTNAIKRCNANITRAELSVSSKSYNKVRLLTMEFNK